MSEKLDRLRAEIETAEKQKEILAHREQRLKNRERYYRKASDRKRTHRLIQYGVMFERYHKELEILTDSEIYSLVEGLLELPEVEALIAAAIAGHEAGDQEGGS